VTHPIQSATGLTRSSGSSLGPRALPGIR
jgi:hypothetical protein